ncbi:MAG: threonine/serine ThrE exporter family protein [Propionibacteriaceae bacterium]
MTLAADIADVLLSMGISASEAQAAAITVCEQFCDRSVAVEVTSTLVTLAQERSTSGIPLALMRPVQGRGVNNTSIQEIDNIVRAVEAGRLGLEAAEVRVHNVVKHPHQNPWWVFPLSAAAVSGAVVPIYSTSWLAALLAFIVGSVCDRTLFLLTRYRVPAFFAQALTAGVTTVVAAALSLAVHKIPGLPAIDPTLVVVGGAVMLLVGLMFVGAFQDAIDENYVTAGARILKVVMLTSGIVVGILGGLMFARSVGLSIIIHPDPPSLSSPVLVSLAGAAVIAAMYCWYCQSTWVAVMAAGITGAITWLVFLGAWRGLGLGLITSAFISAVLAGLLSEFLARRWRIPPSAMTTAGIVTLVPGVMLMAGLMQLWAYPPGTPKFYLGLLTLAQALGIGLAVAGGASLGLYIGRPLKRQLRIARNRALKRTAAQGD